MGYSTTTNMEDIEQDILIDLLVEELPTLRAKIGLSQNEVGEIIGVSRQTYSAIETKKKKMTWSVYLALILLFSINEKTKKMLEASGAFPEELQSILNVDKKNS